MATVFGSTSGSFIKSLQGRINVGIYFTYTQDLYRYQILYDSVLSQLNQYIDMFSTGDYNSLVTNFTTTQYNSLILKASPSNFTTNAINSLTGFKYDPLKFTSMRKSTYKVIDGLEKTVNIVQENTALKKDVVDLTVYKTILEDPAKLIEYIDKQKLNKMAFQASEIFQTEIQLKPWFLEYLKIHGPPGNGVFQSDLLAQIVIRLINAGVITEYEFINS